jgi:hypothetical protein
MVLVLAKTYPALKAAGVSEDHAQAAAEELASFEGRFGSLEGGSSQTDGRIAAFEATAGLIEGEISGIESRITALDTRVVGLKVKAASIEAKINALMGAVGVNIAAMIAILGVLLCH